MKGPEIDQRLIDEHLTEEERAKFDVVSVTDGTATIDEFFADDIERLAAQEKTHRILVKGSKTVREQTYYILVTPKATGTESGEVEHRN
jgi:uncharacterized protein with von Willebrand factor type A (vWA) domain